MGKRKKKKPEIRFKGFTDDWEQRKLGELADVTKLAGFEFTKYVTYSDSGKIIALRGLNVKNGTLILKDVKYIDNSDFSKLGRSKLYQNDILFTYVGTVGELAIINENDRFYLAPNVARIRIEDKTNPVFIIKLMESQDFYRNTILPLIATSSQPALSMENIRKFTLTIAKNKKEQKQIGEYFDKLDHLITLHQRKLNNLKKVKKSMLEKMFPQNGEKEPQIRFCGFNSTWEQRKLGEVVERIVRKNVNMDSTLPLTISAQYGLIAQSEFFDKRVASRDLSGYYLLYNGEFAYNKSTSAEAPWGAIKRLDRYEKGVLSTLYIVFAIRNLDIVDSNYLVTYYDNDLWHKDVSAIAAEGARNHGLLNIAPDDFFATTIKKPKNLTEQKQIGEYFDKLDYLITLHQRKLEKLKKIKKAMLEKMFV